MIFTKVRDVKSPTRGTSGSAGIDFYIPTNEEYLLQPGEAVNIPSGIKVVIEHGYAGIFFNKSSMAVKGLQVGACVVDADYRGEVHLHVRNTSNDAILIYGGQKLVQMLIMKVELTNIVQLGTDEYKMYENTERGEGGFGSTGAY